MGAAEDDRAPTEELPSVNEWYFCSIGTAEDDRSFTKPFQPHNACKELQQTATT
jgi:hypothetical protein